MRLRPKKLQKNSLTLEQNPWTSQKVTIICGYVQIYNQTTLWMWCMCFFKGP